MPATRDDGRDDVDARFAELIAGNFGERVPQRGVAEPTEVGARRPRRRRPAEEREENPSSLLGAWDAADRLDDGEEGRPAPLPPMGRWPVVASAGTVLALLGVVLAILRMVGVPMGSRVLWFAGGAAVVGLALLLLAASRRRGGLGHDGDDGAVV